MLHSHLHFGLLQGLAKAFFYFDAIGSAYAWAMPVLQKQLELAMRNGPKLDNTVYVDDGRAMNPHEPHGIKVV